MSNKLTRVRNIVSSNLASSKILDSNGFNLVLISTPSLDLPKSFKSWVAKSKKH